MKSEKFGLSYPSVLFANVRSAFPKMDTLKILLHSKQVDCFVAAESWFRDHHSDPMVSIADYCCFRDDRTDRIGGGVAVWCRNHLQPETVPLADKPHGVEAIAIRIKSNMLIIGAYVPPQIVLSNNERVSQFFIDFIDSFLNRNPLVDIILCGDFNRLKVDVVCNACNLVNLHNRPTYGAAELDYILISESASLSYSVSETVPIDESKTPHKALIAKPSSAAKSEIKIVRAVYDLRCSNVESFLNLIKRVDWSFLNNTNICLDEKCVMFQDVLQTAFVLSIPVKYVTFTDDTKPWITPLVKQLINDRWQSYREQNFSLYNHLKQKIKKEIEKSKMIWSRKMKQRNVWKVVNETLCCKSSDPMKSLYARFGDVETAANMINLRLTETFSEKKTEAIPLPTSKHFEVVISEYQVYNLLKKLSTYKASPDIPTKLYKSAASMLASPLAAIFNESIKEGVVPNLWKVSAVIPLAKTPRPISTDEVRPISLIPHPAKLLEKVILNFAKPYFLQAYGDDQFGFRPGSSTTCALIKVHDYITKFMEANNVTGIQVISYDFSKAFDRLRHDVIINQVRKCGLPQSIVCWLSSYLDRRMQYVKIGNSLSNLRKVTSGVPQGSVLGPFLFSVVIGSLKVQEDCCVVKYADDVTICVPIYKNSENLHVSKIHDTIRQWSSSFELPLNKEKCKCLCIPRSSAFKCIALEDVTIVEKMTLLGVTFNAKCTWSDHVQSMVKRASRRLFPLRMLKPYLDMTQMKIAYFGLIRSVLEYASPLFVGITKKDAKKLQSVQNRFHRLLCGYQCKNECLQSLDERRMKQSISLYSILLGKDHLLHKLCCTKSKYGRLLLPSVTTTRRLNSFAIKAAVLYNETF